MLVLHRKLTNQTECDITAMTQETGYVGQSDTGGGGRYNIGQYPRPGLNLLHQQVSESASSFGIWNLVYFVFGVKYFGICNGVFGLWYLVWRYTGQPVAAAGKWERCVFCLLMWYLFFGIWDLEWCIWYLLFEVHWPTCCSLR